MYDPMLGQTIEGFKILEQLEMGSVGTVYVGLDIELNTKVAIKVLNEGAASNSYLRQRFLHEIKAEASLEHPNIATLLKAGGTELGQMYMVMPLYKGQTLEKRIKEKALSFHESLNYAIQIAQGLHCAHEQGIIHRDVKPANIFITNEGVVKILDFGVAKLGSDVLTKTGMIVGTMRFMAPEQIEGKPAHFKVDIWAWGLTLFEMLTGQPAFNTKGIKVMFDIMNKEPQRLALHLPKSPLRDELQSILDKALAKNPQERYDNFLQALNDLNSTFNSMLEPTNSFAGQT